jgi:hypothetical protein
MEASSISSGVPTYYKMGRGRCGRLPILARGRELNALGISGSCGWTFLLPAEPTRPAQSELLHRRRRDHVVLPRPRAHSTARRVLLLSEIYCYTNGFTSCPHAVAPPRRCRSSHSRTLTRWRLVSNSFPGHLSSLSFRTKPSMRLVLLCAWV